METSDRTLSMVGSKDDLMINSSSSSKKRFSITKMKLQDAKKLDNMAREHIQNLEIKIISCQFVSSTIDSCLCNIVSSSPRTKVTSLKEGKS